MCTPSVIFHPEIRLKRIHGTWNKFLCVQKPKKCMGPLLVENIHWIVGFSRWAPGTGCAYRHCRPADRREQNGIRLLIIACNKNSWKIKVIIWIQTNHFFRLFLIHFLINQSINHSFYCFIILFMFHFISIFILFMFHFVCCFLIDQSINQSINQ